MINIYSSLPRTCTTSGKCVSMSEINVKSMADNADNKKQTL
jgi:hypothetical protein